MAVSDSIVVPASNWQELVGDYLGFVGQWTTSRVDLTLPLSDNPVRLKFRSTPTFTDLSTDGHVSANLLKVTLGARYSRLWCGIGGGVYGQAFANAV